MNQQWPADKVERRSVDSLLPYAKNSRTHDDAQIAAIAASIKEWGWTVPVLVDTSGTLIAGHGRILAARKLGIKEVPTMVADGWTDAQRRAYVIADNKLTIKGGWNDELLALELGDLKDDGFNIDLIGFDESELDALFADKGTEGLTDPDETPEPPVNPVTVLGDVWVMGNHRIICGDSTDADTVAKVLNGVKPHLMVTDPPYGVEYDPNWRSEAAERPGKAKGSFGGAKVASGVVANDDQADWTEAWALFPGDVAYVWHAAEKGHIVAAGLQSVGLEMRAQIIWAKNRMIISRRHYHPHHEPCWYAVRKNATGHWSGDRKQTTLWQIDHNKSDTGHSTQKPVECMKRPIENNSSPGQAVYDPFGGSGTTLIAAEQTGRACHMIELNPAYVDVCVKRWMQFTGNKATLEGDGRTFEEINEARYASADWAKNCAGSYDDAVHAAREQMEGSGVSPL